MTTQKVNQKTQNSQKMSTTFDNENTSEEFKIFTKNQHATACKYISKVKTTVAK